MRQRLALFISGGGTTMEAIIKACQSGEIAMDVACIIASTPDAGGIQKARALGIPPTKIIIANPDDFSIAATKIDQEAFGQHIVQILQKQRATVVTLNGWLHLIPELVINAFPKTIFNQHPGPVPEFGGPGMYGRRVHAARLLFARMVKREYWTEAIAQRVHRDFDLGEVVKMTRVAIQPDDTVEELQQRVLPVEHRVQIELLKDVVSGTVQTVAARESLVRSGEEETLVTVKKIARMLYPHG